MSQAPASPCDLQATPVRPEMVSAAMVISLSSTDGNVAKPVCVRHVVAASHCGRGDPWELVRIALAKRLEAVDLCPDDVAARGRGSTMAKGRLKPRRSGRVPRARFSDFFFMLSDRCLIAAIQWQARNCFPSAEAARRSSVEPREAQVGHP